MKVPKFYGKGKVILTAEYFVLDGALALALPCKLGQYLIVKEFQNNAHLLNWVSKDSKDKIWFECEINLGNFTINNTTHQQTSNSLISILKAINLLNPAFFNSPNSFSCETQLEFPENWGLGSSSTLIYTLSQWTHTSPYELLKNTFGGSGYDIACANSKHPLLYKLKKNVPIIKTIQLSEEITSQLVFVYLNKKQNSREGIEKYNSIPKNKNLINKISQLTLNIAHSQQLKNFEQYIEEHENLVSHHLKIPKVKDLYFNDYTGTIKSLGAWGGDFIVITKRNNYKEYFNAKGFHILLEYKDLIS